MRVGSSAASWPLKDSLHRAFFQRRELTWPSGLMRWVANAKVGGSNPTGSTLGSVVQAMVTSLTSGPQNAESVATLGSG